MRVKKDFVLRTVAGENVIISSGDMLNLNVMITVNETGRFLWERLQSETTKEELIDALLAEYEVEESVAKVHVNAFIQKLDDNGFIE